MAEFFRLVAVGAEVPQVPETAPDKIAAFLEQIAEAAAKDEEGLIDLRKLGQEILEFRWSRAALSDAVVDRIAKLEREGDDERSAIAEFLRALAEPDSLPTVPQGGFSEVLAFVLEMAERKTPPVDLTGLGHAIISAVNSGVDLAPEAKRDIRLLSLAGGDYRIVAVALSAILRPGSESEVPVDKLPGKLRGFVKRVAACASDLFVPAINFPMFFLLGDDLPVDLDKLSQDVIECYRSGSGPSSELSERIVELGQLGSPHDAVAQSLAALSHRMDPIPLEGNLPGVIEWYLEVVRAVAEKRPVPMRLDLVGLAALRSRICKLPMATYAAFGFRVLKSGTAEACAAAEFLQRIATCEEVPEVPEDTSGEVRRQLLQIQAMAEFGHLARLGVRRPRKGSG